MAESMIEIDDGEAEERKAVGMWVRKYAKAVDEEKTWKGWLGKIERVLGKGLGNEASNGAALVGEKKGGRRAREEEKMGEEERRPLQKGKLR